MSQNAFVPGGPLNSQKSKVQLEWLLKWIALRRPMPGIPQRAIRNGEIAGAVPGVNGSCIFRKLPAAKIDMTSQHGGPGV
jgi:hypothetical protein